MFRRTPKEHILQKWVQPDWKAMPTWEQLQADYKQSLADQKAADRAKLLEERAKLLEERKQRTEQAAAEQAEKQKALAEARQQQLQNKVQLESDAPAKDQTEATVKRSGQQSSWIMDNIIIIASVLVFVAMGAVFVYKQ